MANKTVSNEQTKLLAIFFNSLAVAFLTTGIIGPVVAIIYGFGGGKPDGVLVLLSSSICAVVSGCLHLVGRFALEGMKE
ncbi:MAG: hypothetical protein ABWY18_08480 [Tardiphaga sp.]